ncbi:MAG: NAD(P)-dependent oxidoreductase [Gammaproteobacteria bacterium]|nr:NAD(P)-dependent oxidoreductase [Gammaproteobacteria bacterium]
MRIAITGSSGRIGRAIHFALCRDHEVVGIDRAVASVTTRLGDIGDYPFLRKAFEGCGAVVHTAALHAPHVGVIDDSEFYRINVEGTKTVVRAAMESGVQKLVFTSTTALYGDASRNPDEAAWIDETTVPEPRTVYHRTKLEAEQFLESKAGPKLQVTTLRMSRCFPEPASLMAAYRLHRGVDGRDVAEGHRLALAGSEESYRMFILSGATPFRRSDCPALKRSARQVLLERCPALVELYEARGWALPQNIGRVYDPSKAQRSLGWRPRYGFEEVVRLLDAQIPEVLPQGADCR